uniref:NAD-dependent epimerase/dehydratase family protein n=1 Tax=Clostridium sp. TaxID=1506 RepID=UPI002627EF3C
IFTDNNYFQIIGDTSFTINSGSNKNVTVRFNSLKKGNYNSHLYINSNDPDQTQTTINLTAISLRYQNVYGPGQSLKNPYTGIISIFSNLARMNKKIEIFEDGLESRDFVYVDDVVQATVLSIENENSNQSSVYNVGMGKQTSVLEIASTIIENINPENEIEVTGKYRIGDIRHNFADISKISADLGYNPKWDIKLGI